VLSWAYLTYIRKLSCSDHSVVTLKSLRASARSLLPLTAPVLLAGCDSIVLRPSGDVAAQQGLLVVQSTLLMLVIIVPVIALTLLFAWRYRQSNKQARYTPDWDHSVALELLIWAAPLLIIIALGALTWIGTHTLDPYRSLRRIDAARRIPTSAPPPPLVVEVVALDWKWLFIYPEQGVAVVNEVAAPVDRQIRFKITSWTVMNSFFVPALAGQIYAMPGMETKLHAVINRAGVYEGFSANFSGEGFSDMRFKFRGVSDAEFDAWLQQARSAGGELNRQAYLELAKPGAKHPVRRYGNVAPGLYDLVVNRCVEAGKTCMKDQMAMDERRSRERAGSFPAFALGAVCTADDPTGSGGRRAVARD
jgi:cytochrome o ubiquinol oxidase subunit 2